MAIIEVNHVSKEFRLGKSRSLRQTIGNSFARVRGRGMSPRAPFRALDDVSFSIESGEVVGFIGHNGAGKSTLLKLLARVTQPTTGQVRVSGKVAPLIEVGAGLIGELSGRENIFLNGVILGMKRAQVARKFDEIVAFAELEEFIDTPLKRYSTGMQVRLGFAIATSVDAQILIVDEVLAVGDLAFQRKCYDRMQQMIKNEGRTILLVSHDLREIERVCHRVLLLDHGRVLEDGSPKQVCNHLYERSFAKIREDAARTQKPGAPSAESGEVEVLDIALLDANGLATNRLSYEAPFAFRLRLRALQELTSVVIIVGIQTTDFLNIATHSSEEQFRIPCLPSGVHEIQCRFEHMPLLPGVFSLRLEVAQGHPNHGVFFGENLLNFQVTMGERLIPLISREGFMEIRGVWSTRPIDNVPGGEMDEVGQGADRETVVGLPRCLG